ncbi:hypothetical protein GCM10010483_59250 [Actinokineospora diospyrosa]
MSASSTPVKVEGATARAANAVCSFSGDTAVLMADGTGKPIEDVAEGDLVVAADPEIGEQGPRRVTATWPHTDTIYQLALTDGRRIDTTEDHLFWNASRQKWQRADALKPGDQLLTAEGGRVAVQGMVSGAGRVDRAYVDRR